MRRVYILMLAAIIAIAATAPTGGNASAASGPIVGSYSRVAGTAYLRLRTGPSYNYGIIMNMPKGEVVRIISGPHNYEWYKVSYRGRIGYSIRPHLVHTGLAGATIARSYYKVVVVSLGRQQVEAYQGGVIKMVTAATTGRPELATPTGTTQVMARFSPYKFVSPWPKGHPYYYEPGWANYAIRFRSGGYYLHDASWRPFYGYGTNYGHYDPDGVWRTGSHGCVNLPLWATGWMYNFSTVGTTVRVVSW